MNQSKIQLYDNQPIRTAWDEENEEWFFSIVDVVRILTDQHDFQKARKYWNKLKERLLAEGNAQDRFLRGVRRLQDQVSV